MLLDDLKAAYPGCPDALEWAEDCRTAYVWDQVRDYGMGPQDALQAFRAGIRLLIEHYPQHKHKAEVTLQQTYSPGFARYVAAKLGAV